MTSFSPQELATFLVYDFDHEHNIAAIQHRQQVTKAWGIPPGSSILEIGCGQGDFTVVLADAVGAAGRVVAVDPAPPDWGSSAVDCFTFLASWCFQLLMRVGY